jgi:hypothetical protein
MMKTLQVGIVFFATFLLSGCPWDDVQKDLDKNVAAINNSINNNVAVINDSINETRKTFASVAKDAVLAVPGAEWGQLIRDLNGPDKDKRDAASAYLKNVMHEDPTVEYTATVWFDGIPTDEPLEVILVRTDTPTLSEIELNNIRRNLVERSTIHGSSLSGRSPAEIKANISRILLGALNKICGEGTTITTGQPGFPGIPVGEYETIHWNSELMPAPYEGFSFPEPATQQKRLTAMAREAMSKRQALASEMAECIVNPYGTLVPGTQLPVAETVWKVTDTRQYLTILLNQNHFNKLKKDLRMQTVVHKRDDANVMVGRLNRITVDPNEFEPIGAHGLVDLKIPNEPQKYVWNSINMTDFQGYDASVAERVEELQNKLHDWSQLEVRNPK